MKVDWTLILCGIGLVLIAGFLFYFYWSQKQPGVKEGMKRSDEGNQPPRLVGTEAAKPTLVLFYSTTCHHCDALKPAWFELRKRLQEGGVVSEDPAQSKLDVIEIEGSHPDVAKMGVNGFPTIRMYPQSLKNMQAFVQYKGNRSVDDLMEFIFGKGPAEGAPSQKQ